MYISFRFWRKIGRGCAHIREFLFLFFFAAGEGGVEGFLNHFRVESWEDHMREWMAIDVGIYVFRTINQPIIGRILLGIAIPRPIPKTTQL